MPIGWNNGLPFRVGGGPTIEDRMLAELEQALGYGLFPSDVEDSIDGLFIIGTAKALAASGSFDEAAAMQAFPRHASDAVSDYEEVLQIAIETSEQELRRQAVDEAWVLIPPTTFPEIRAALLDIDARYALVDVPWEAAATTHWGRTMQGQAGQDDWGGWRTATDIPMYATNEVLYAFLDISAVFGSSVSTFIEVDGANFVVVDGSGFVVFAETVTPSSLTDSDRLSYEKGRRLLHDSLPAWMDYQIATGTVFTLDVSMLDGTMLGS